MSTPSDADVTRSTVVAGSDPGRVALASVLARLSARHWVDLLVPATLVFALEWLLGLPLAVGVLLAVATVAVIVTLRIRQARRRFARSFPVGERLTVTAGPRGLVVTQGEQAPIVDARWTTIDAATMMRDHLVVTRRGAQEQVVLPAAVSDRALMAAVRAGIARTTGEDLDPQGPAVPAPADARSDDRSATHRAPTDPARVTTAEVDEATIARMARDFTLDSLTSVSTMLLLGLLVVLSVAVQFSASATTRWVLPAVTLVLIALVVGGGYLGTRRMLRKVPTGRITLAFGDDGFTTTSSAGATHTAYSDLSGVTVRGETVMLRGQGGAIALHPRSLFPDPLLAEVRAGMSRH
ncbi:hypothetical protein [Humibacillus xanthopallidus]|uniref:hypothetical protein n=1 Tax=Humibacillus xanthopallidus TaxID=412689 RepID=UPI00384ED347